MAATHSELRCTAIKTGQGSAFRVFTRPRANTNIAFEPSLFATSKLVGPFCAALTEQSELPYLSILMRSAARRVTKPSKEMPESTTMEVKPAIFLIANERLQSQEPKRQPGVASKKAWPPNTPVASKPIGRYATRVNKIESTASVRAMINMTSGVPA